MIDSAIAGAAIALSASSDTFSVAIRTQKGAIHGLSTEGKRQSAEATAMLDSLLARCNLASSDVTEIRVDRGPGSYTGLRMALTFARVLAAFTPVRLRATTSIEILALAAWLRQGVPTTSPVRPILDARRQRVHTARVELVAGHVVLASPPLATALDSCRSLVRDDEVVLLAPSLAGFLAPGPASPLPAILASDLFHPFVLGVDVQPDALEPLYLMGTYAE